MSFPLMPFSDSPVMLSQAEVADFAYNNYLSLYSNAGKGTSTSTQYSHRFVRNEAGANGYNTNPTGRFFPPYLEPATGIFDGCTLLFFDGCGNVTSAPISNVIVNELADAKALSITQVYNGSGNSSNTGAVSMYYGYIPLMQPQQIESCSATFTVPSGTLLFQASCIYIIPGKWTPQTSTRGTAGGALTVSIAANEMVAYSCYNATSGGGTNITYTAGTLIAHSKADNGGGAQHGLVYRTTSGPVTLTPTSLSSTGYVFATKLVYG